MLRRKKVLAFTGMLLALGATLLGGASVEINEPLHDGMAIGLDWFLLDLFLMAMIYVPLERLWPQYPQQSTFRLLLPLARGDDTQLDRPVGQQHPVPCPEIRSQCGVRHACTVRVAEGRTSGGVESE